jgi:uncharacterized protein Usg
MTKIADHHFVMQLQGFSLVTAVITYRMPDYRSLLQEYIWQEYDQFPDLNALRKFLHFWECELEGPIHSVHVAHAQLLTPAEVRLISDPMYLH